MKLSTIHDAIKAYKEGYRWAARSSESQPYYVYKYLSVAKEHALQCRSEDEATASGAAVVPLMDQIAFFLLGITPFSPETEVQVEDQTITVDELITAVGCLKTILDKRRK